ncbi:translation initiation factor IF-2-like [Tyto alba]|uniref:translation initiation factor IF-2-like n=1 Tax=Tyto alba TaxID=56313 RepID=UPI001C67DEAA|nr:translation initiation factor IF-2-like [Tyto alba]
MPKTESKHTSHALTLALARSPADSPARSLGPLPQVCDQRCPGRPTSQQRKSRAKKIKGIRQALLPVTYIFPAAARRLTAAAGLRGTPARRPTQPPRRNGGKTAPTPGRERLRARRGGPAARSEARPQPPPPPSRLPPRGAQPLPGTESFPGEGQGELRSLSAEATGSGREGGREGGDCPGKSPSATGQPGPALLPQEGGIPLKPALTERPGGSVPSGRASPRPRLGTGRGVWLTGCRAAESEKRGGAATQRGDATARERCSLSAEDATQVLLGACFSASRRISSPLSLACTLCSIVPHLQKTLRLPTSYKLMGKKHRCREGECNNVLLAIVEDGISGWTEPSVRAIIEYLTSVSSH